MEAKKLEKLIHYSERPLKKFIQYDVFTNMEPNSDDVMTSDSDGDSTTCGETQELMHGSTVRVLILPGTKKKDILRALKKIRSWIKRDGLFSDEFIRQEMKEMQLSKPQKGEDFIDYLNRTGSKTEQLDVATEKGKR